MIFNVIEYCNKIIENKDNANGELYILACKRFIKDYNNPLYYYDSNKVERCIRFISMLNHFTGKFNNKSFILMPWQKFIVANIIGLYNKETNTRKYNSTYLQVSRKNGKTAFAAALSLYFLIADNEHMAEVILASNSVDQTKIDFQYCLEFSNQLDKKRFNKYRNSLTDKKNNSLKVISSNKKTGDGYNCSFGLIDEYGAADTDEIKGLIQSSQGMRQNPHLMIITSASFNKGVCYEHYINSIDILKGLKEDDTHFACIFQMNDHDNWRDEKKWIKANPNLNVTVNLPWLRNQVQKAINTPSEEVPIRTKNLNVWCSTSDTWIADDYIIDVFKSKEEILSMFNKADFYYCAIDLSSVTDLTAVSFLCEYKGLYYSHTAFFLPEESIQIHKLFIEIESWKAKDELIITPGNVVDYDYILKYILDFNKKYKARCRKIYYDRYNSTQFAISCTNEGLPIEPCSQTLGTFNSGTRGIEKFILEKKLFLSQNSLMLFNFRCVQLKYDHNNNCKPFKDEKNRYTKKIDGVITLIMSLLAYNSVVNYSYEIV